MEILLALGIAGVAFWALNKQATGSSSGSGSPPPGSPPPGSPPPNPPPVVGPPQPVPAKPPGVYPPNTPGTYPLQLMLQGGDGFGLVSASPGGTLAGDSGQAATFWYGPGTWVTFTAQVTGWPASIGTAFDHFDGPGVSTKQNPFSAQIGSAGYVRAVFSTFGFVGV